MTARLASHGEAVAAIRATLETLAERLTPGQVKNLAAQLPREIAYYLEHRAESLERFGLAVTKGIIDDVRAQLPNEFAPLFESGAQGRMEAA